MPTFDSGESRRIPMRSHGGGQVTSPADQQQSNQEQLPCPRCDSTNTKFCYYNNYNFSQPRHFCKSCRRYWTHGGTLRDIPIGGGSRKSAKRSRTCSSVISNGNLTAPLQATPVLFPSSSISTTVTTPNDNESKGNALSLCGSFTSLLNANANASVTQGIGGFGIGLSSGFDDVGFGLGRAMWPFSSVGDHATSGVGSNGGHAAPIPATWQFEGLESSNSGGFVSSEYFAWPELSITTPGNTLK